MAALFAVGPAHAQIRVPGLSPTPPDRVAVFTVKGPGVAVPFIAFQERARRTVEAHMHAELVSMDEALTRGGPDLPKRLAACRGEAACFARELSSTLETRYLLVITANRLDRTRLVGARLLDLKARTVVGEAIDEVPRNQTYTDVVPDRIQASVPAERWNPFGRLRIDVSEPGAQIAVNGRIIGLSPSETVTPLMPGTYEISADKRGFLAVRQRVRIVRGRSTAVRLALIPEEGDSDATWWIVGGTVGAVVVAAAITVGVVLGQSSPDPRFCSAPDPSACR